MTNSNFPFSNTETVVEAFESEVARQLHKTAVVLIGTKYSYSQMGRWVRRFAAALYELGVREGDKMILYIPNSPQWIIAWFGIQKIGGIAVPINPIYTSYDLRYIANDSGAETIICSGVNFGYIKKVISETKLKRVIVTNVFDLLPWWKILFGNAFDKLLSGRVSRDKNTYFFKRLIHRSPPDPPAVKKGGGDGDILEIIYTGGTTKYPRGVPITHRLFLECAYEQINNSSPLFPNEENIILSGAPFFPILGQTCGLTTLCMGGTLLLLPNMNLDGLLETIERFGAKTLIGVPTLYQTILGHGRIDLYDLRSLQYCLSGGDVLPVDVRNRWFEKFNQMIYQGYVTTETCGAVAMSTVGMENPPRSMGRVFPSKKIKVVDPDTLESIPLGEAGELLISFERMVTSYWNKPEETAVSFIELESRQWYRTSDIVSVDDRGYLYFVDRTIDAIKHKGYRVSSSEIESVLQEHPAVIGACVVGVPNPEVGERIKAFVILKGDIKGITGYDLIKWCDGRLSSYKVPQYVEFRDTLPKSKSGKLLRREVRAEERKRFEKDE